ncbi:class I SAM-dependent methyltransferase [Natronolimnobius sp. AArcel1]|uniref:class I SAM-dependent methyltransferase n=1 Tax=Natronolimnobius sp. AArcel1 TaxID=1679093 RepID=UPI0013ED29BA|nr:class I SAM-dependent methyltransferase [Natronolimnobius sp. AArcel1]NGM70950.1 class I SAM-dependent methyltransferase [Natronolimnobius sp. AArcel1]
MQAYLEAKRTVDDRALNRRVLERLQAELTRDEPVRIVELGAGMGTMLPRLAEWGLLPDRVSYHAVDHNATTIERAQDRLPAELEARGYDVLRSDKSGTATFVAHPNEDHLESPNSQCSRLEVTLECGDALSLELTADLIIAAAFLDLVDADIALPAIESMLADGGLLYAPITYDGATGFAPRDPLDSRLEQAYHRHMDEYRSGGRSDAGRHLLSALPARNWDLLESGGSAWVVRPREAGEGYPHREAVVVEHILETIDGAVSEVLVDEPEIATARELERWLERRLAELERGELVYTAANLDILARPLQ